MSTLILDETMEADGSQVKMTASARRLKSNDRMTHRVDAQRRPIRPERTVRIARSRKGDSHFSRRLDLGIAFGGGVSGISRK